MSRPSARRKLATGAPTAARSGRLLSAGPRSVNAVTRPPDTRSSTEPGYVQRPPAVRPGRPRQRRASAALRPRSGRVRRAFAPVPVRASQPEARQAAAAGRGADGHGAATGAAGAAGVAGRGAAPAAPPAPGAGAPAPSDCVPFDGPNDTTVCIRALGPPVVHDTVPRAVTGSSEPGSVYEPSPTSMRAVAG